MQLLRCIYTMSQATFVNIKQTLKSCLYHPYAYIHFPV